MWPVLPRPSIGYFCPPLAEVTPLGTHKNDSNSGGHNARRSIDECPGVTARHCGTAAADEQRGAQQEEPDVTIPVVRDRAVARQLLRRLPDQEWSEDKECQLEPRTLT